MSTVLADISPDILPDQPVLIAGPTASGKSELALRIAERHGGIVVNADASQVYECWQVLTARPDAADLARAPHALYGHLPFDAPYSVGHWLRELADLLAGGARPIIVGGTGLYFSALTEGLSEIPPVPDAVRAEADDLPLEALLADLGPETRARLDIANRARVQRAWEVERATGEPLHHWQGRKSPALIAPETACRILLNAPKDWLTPRIETRFETMLRTGGLEEARAMASRYDPKLPSCRAIGVAEAMAVLDGTLTEVQAITRASIATRQYAKRQRTWFRSKMTGWHKVAAPTLAQLTL